MPEPSALCQQLRRWVHVTQEAVIDALRHQGCAEVGAVLESAYTGATGVTRAVAALLGDGDPVKGLSVMQLCGLWISLKSAHIGLVGPHAWEMYPPMLGETGLASLLEAVCREAAAPQGEREA